MYFFKIIFLEPLSKVNTFNDVDFKDNYKLSSYIIFPAVREEVGRIDEAKGNPGYIWKEFRGVLRGDGEDKA